MQYKHAFHAGNVADVHKHIWVLQVISALQKKAKGFLYMDTHAGAGLYDLSGADARHSGESDAGFQRLEREAGSLAAALHPAIAGYLEAVANLRRHLGARSYPGSPLLAAAALRNVDQCLCVESQAQTARALQRAFEQAALPLPQILNDDGYQQVKAALPPALRRGMVLIDPPYEVDEEERHISAALAAGLERFETGVFLLWYPIKKQHDADLFLARVLRGVTRPALAAELCVRPADNTAGLNGSGMLVINPPWQCDQNALAWQEQLHTLLGGRGGSTVKWLINE
jgi:23S rRNA (adenine2030-N6)-methyltransferase